ncbi:unnamed protein product [Rangifer tarandus platyrhynchus]|uniref:Uncharacterized protein n=1 Tax=Rangifer tarandus platyrhynchus TaxID=3082113 RepID=A0AC59ZVR1_RANTA
MGLSLQGLLPANTQGPLNHVLAPGLGGEGAGTAQPRCREATLGTPWGGGLALDTGRLGPSRGNALLSVRSVGHRMRYRAAKWPGHPVPTELRAGVILATPTSLEAHRLSGCRPIGQLQVLGRRSVGLGDREQTCAPCIPASAGSLEDTAQGGGGPGGLCPHRSAPT